MENFEEFFPSKDEILDFEPEELAPYLLKYLNQLENNRTKLNRYNFGNQLRELNLFTDTKQRDALGKLLMEAWVWLESEVFLAPSVGDQGDWRYITQRGKKAIQEGNFIHFTNGKILQRKALHPVLAQKIWPTFVRGDYDTAIFQSFKEVEVNVRKVGGFPNDLIGVKLMNAAFHSETGPLRDEKLLPAERQAEAALFVGAIGRYKNPPSHRDIDIDTPEIAAEIIYLASHLLRIVDSRRTPSDLPHLVVPA